jgi:hypothetical protein
MLTKLPSFTKDTVFVGYEKQLINYLGSKKGIIGVPLKYILRKHDAPVAVGTVFSLVHERLVLKTLLSGHAYAEDNGKVWELLLQLVLDGPGWAYALPYEKKWDGRGAFKAMKPTTWGHWRWPGQRKKPMQRCVSFDTQVIRRAGRSRRTQTQTNKK